MGKSRDRCWFRGTLGITTVMLMMLVSVEQGQGRRSDAHLLLVTEPDDITDSTTDFMTEAYPDSSTDTVTTEDETSTYIVTEIVTDFETTGDLDSTTDSTKDYVTEIVTDILTNKTTEGGPDNSTYVVTETVTDFVTEGDPGLPTTDVSITGNISTDIVTDIVTDVLTVNTTQAEPGNATDIVTVTEIITELINTTYFVTERDNTTETVTEFITVNGTAVVTELVNETDSIRPTEVMNSTDFITEDFTIDGTELNTETAPLSTMVTDVASTATVPPEASNASTSSPNVNMTTIENTTAITFFTTENWTTDDVPTTIFPTTNASTTNPTTELWTTEPTTMGPTTTEATTRPPPPEGTTLPMTTKRRTVDDDLKDLLETPVTEENVEEVSKELAELTEDTEDMSAEGVETSAELLANITALNSTDPEVTTSVVETINNLMNVDEAELAEAGADGATNQAVQSLETQLQFVNVSASNGTYTDVQPNLGVQVSEYDADILEQGLTFTYSTDNPDGDLNPDDMKVHFGEDQSTRTTQARLSLPPSIRQTIKGNKTRVSFVLYRTTSLFPSRSLNGFNQNQSTFTRSANTRIVSATVDGTSISNLSEPVVTSYTPVVTRYDYLIDNVNNSVCVYWDFEADDGYGNWSTKGCYMENVADINDIRCRCDHLTNFAVLMDIYHGSLLTERQDFILEVMSYVGCCLSAVCILATLITFLSVKKLREYQPNRILMCLCSALLLLYIFFLVLISLGEVTMVTCGVVAGFLHFSLLSSICWMAVESFNLYRMVIKVFEGSFIQHFMLKATAFAVGVPIVVVVITGGAAGKGYMNYDPGKMLCGFLSLWPLVGAVLVPMALMIIYDTVIFTMVMRRLTRKVVGKQMTQSRYKERMRRLQSATALLVTMGLTWGVGYLTSIEVETAHFAFQTLFTVLNSLQGVFLFLFYCVRNPTARALWSNTICRCLPTLDELSSYRTRSTVSGSRSRAESETAESGSEERKKWWEPGITARGVYDLGKAWGKRRPKNEAFNVQLEPSVLTPTGRYRASCIYEDDDEVYQGINGVMRDDNSDDQHRALRGIGEEGETSFEGINSAAFNDQIAEASVTSATERSRSSDIDGDDDDDDDGDRGINGDADSDDQHRAPSDPYKHEASSFEACKSATHNDQIKASATDRYRSSYIDGNDDGGDDGDQCVNGFLGDDVLDNQHMALISSGEAKETSSETNLAFDDQAEVRHRSSYIDGDDDEDKDIMVVVDDNHSDDQHKAMRDTGKHEATSFGANSAAFNDHKKASATDRYRSSYIDGNDDLDDDDSDNQHRALIGSGEDKETSSETNSDDVDDDDDDEDIMVVVDENHSVDQLMNDENKKTLKDRVFASHCIQEQRQGIVLYVLYRHDQLYYNDNIL